MRKKKPRTQYIREDSKGEVPLVERSTAAMHGGGGNGVDFF